MERRSPITLYGYFYVLAATVGLLGLAAGAPRLYRAVTVEDALVEYLGFAGLIAVGIVLARTARLERARGRAGRAILLALAAALFVWAAGEEISWGQRLFGIETPPSLLEINAQGELNLHNINKRFFDRTVKRITVLIIVAGMVLFFAGRERLFGFVLPDPAVVYTFIIASTWRRYVPFDLDPLLLGLAAAPAYLVWFVWKRDHAMIAATAVLVGLLGTTVWTLIEYDARLGPHATNEVRETITVCGFLLYALALQRDASRSR